MKDILKIICLSILIIISFYYTDKVALIVQNNNPIVKEINRQKNRYETSPIDATVDGSTIIPGISGKSVNVIKSFKNMKKLGEFNEHYLIHDEVTPSISILNNLDKIIISGNSKNNEVSIIIKDNNNIKDYFITNDIKVNILFTEDMTIKNNNLEYINHESTKTKFNNVESLLNKNKKNKHICVIENNLNICEDYKKHLVMPYLSLTLSNIIDIKNNIKKGSIILIKDTAKLTDVKILINQINYLDYNIIHLSELISEIRQN